jgi:electron transport protein HydN
MSRKFNSFVVCDPAKCNGCRVCEMACHLAHLDSEPLTAGGLDAPVFSRLALVKVEDRSIEVNCRHCEDAPCANVCPVGAIQQVNNAIVINADVLVNGAVCVGCKTCLLACPFGAIELIPVFKGGRRIFQKGLTREAGPDGAFVPKETITASKCDLCSSLDEGPACVRHCPEKALELIDPLRNRREKNRRAVEGFVDLFGGLPS